MIDIDDLSDLNENIEEPSFDDLDVAQTDEDSKGRQNKCPKCGATDISLNPSSGLLRCHFCRYEAAPEEAVKEVTDIRKLEGQIIGSGAEDIIADTDDVLTFKCSSCGAEVVIDTSEALQARCHWCRNTLSINEQIPNGAVPDKVLPFSVTKDNARQQIEKFVKKRQFFAHPKFKAEFQTDNIMGVYLPYMVVDANATAKLVGQGEHLIRKYTVTTGSGKNQRTRTYYDADLYDVEREFDLIVEGLTIESNLDKLQHKSADKTNNVVNAVKPFDTENSLKWDANYLRGYTSQKRDTNVEELGELVEVKIKDIARHRTNETLKKYDRGVKWSREQLNVKGKQWKAAYLPIWLYSYQKVSSSGQKTIHYVAVNGRSQKTMGSVPIHTSKLCICSILVGIPGGFILGPIIAILAEIDDIFLLSLVAFVLITGVFYATFYSMYRNPGARHAHEATKSEMENIKASDKLVKRQKRLSNATMSGANNTDIYYQGAGSKAPR